MQTTTKTSEMTADRARSEWALLISETREAAEAEDAGDLRTRDRVIGNRLLTVRHLLACGVPASIIAGVTGVGLHLS